MLRYSHSVDQTSEEMDNNRLVIFALCTYLWYSMYAWDLDMELRDELGE